MERTVTCNRSKQNSNSQDVASYANKVSGPLGREPLDFTFNFAPACVELAKKRID